jgi:hypothetical protein
VEAEEDVAHTQTIAVLAAQAPVDTFLKVGLLHLEHTQSLLALAEQALPHITMVAAGQTLH